MTKKRAKQQLAGKAATGTKKPRASAAASTGDPATDSFLAWCATVGIKHPKCTIGVLPGTGRGVIATQDIQHGEVVVEVPDDAVLMVETCRIGDSLEGTGPDHALMPTHTATLRSRPRPHQHRSATAQSHAEPPRKVARFELGLGVFVITHCRSWAVKS